MTSPVYRNRLRRQNAYLVNWSADDGDVLVVRSGQVATYSRAAGDTVTTSTGTASVAYSQPRWLDTAVGAAALMKPSTDAWAFSCDFYVQPLWVYLVGVVPAQSGSGTVKLLRIGDGTAPTFDLATTFDATGFLNTIGQYQDGSTNPSATLTGSTSGLGVVVEYLLQMDSTYKATVSRCVSGGSVLTSSASSAGVAYGSATGFHGGTLRVADSANAATFAYRQILVGPGVAPTMDQCRGLAI